MYPEDRVLVGVIKAKRDFTHVRDDHWYRIPQAQMPYGVDVEVLAFFLSGGVFKSHSGGIYYYAPVTGLELAYRRDLLPDEPEHPRACHVYYRVAIAPLQPKAPPVLNPSKRVISFIHTTWDRFSVARTIADLYSESAGFVPRVRRD